MPPHTPPPIIFQGRHWSSGEIVRLAQAWREVLSEKLSTTATPVAMVMVNRPEAVALFFALTSFPAPVILLPPEPLDWQSAPSIPAGTLLVLLPNLDEFTAAAEHIGLRVTVLPDPGSVTGAPDPGCFLTSAGVVLFTSGSTSRPRPVYRRMTQVLAAASDVMAAIGPTPGCGIICGLPVARAFGFNHGLMAATVLGSPLALLERFDPHVALNLFSSGRYQYWAGTPMMADWLSRSPSSETPAAPPSCVVAGHVSVQVLRRFKERFGVSIMQLYGSTEAAAITVDTTGGGDEGSGTAGHPLPGVELRIGDDPHASSPPGAVGRIWLSSPRCLMEGYGFPPNVERLGSVDGWWPTPDIGCIDEGGLLTVVGRADDCFRTDAGQLVNPASVGAALEGLQGVTDVAAVPLDTSKGPVLGVLVEGGEALSVVELRRHLARTLPAWGQPRVLKTTRTLPRLSNGKADRRACMAILADDFQ